MHPLLDEPIVLSDADYIGQRTAQFGEPWISAYDPVVLQDKVRALGFREVDVFEPDALNGRYFYRRKYGLRTTTRLLLARVSRQRHPKTGNGGLARNRTGIRGFAVRYVTIPPRDPILPRLPKRSPAVLLYSKGFAGSASTGSILPRQWRHLMLATTTRQAQAFFKKQVFSTSPLTFSTRHSISSASSVR